MSNQQDKKNGFDRASADVVGDLLKKGSGSDWYRAGSPVDMAATYAVIMDSMRMGDVLWENNKISCIDADYVIRAGVPEDVRSGWQPYSSVLLIDEAGLLLTFTSSSWGGKNALVDLIPQYRMQGQRAFPLVKLSSRARGNQPTAKGVDTQLYHLWLMLSQTVDASTCYAIDSVARRADARRRSCRRTSGCANPALAALAAKVEKHTSYQRAESVIAGVSLETRTRPRWAEQLSPDEAILAASYATLEINGFPSWFAELAVTKPAETRSVLFGEVAAELADPEPRDRYECLKTFHAPTILSSN